MRIFAIGIEHPLDVSIECEQHLDASMRVWKNGRRIF
jgi:hypothetical protein